MTHSLARGFWSVLLRAYLKTYFRLTIIGKENLPPDQSYVLVSNHASHLDALCLLSCLPLRSVNRVFAVAAKDYFFRSFFKSLLSVICVNALPFDRDKQPKQSLELCADVLDAAEQILIMFPEGTRSTDGNMQPFKPGIGLLVASTPRLIVPSYIKGAHEAWPKGHGLPKPKKITVTIGKPMDFRQMERNKGNYRSIAQKIEDAVRHLQEGGTP
jgi:1-acyl-sn-glycerol-3-phosphate acyltransferase/long-chain acyl-CoA synthetase